MSKHILTAIKDLNCHLVVFDLDSTLINVQPRTQQILNEFVSQYPHISQSLTVSPRDWGLLSCLDRELPQLEPQLKNQALNEWKQKFFDPDYLIYDTPMPGAVAFAQQLALWGLEIQYLTGRNKKRLLKKTEEQLNRFGFPSGKINMKDNPLETDPIFKSNWFKDVSLKIKGPCIPFFENEPSILWKVIEDHSHFILPVWVDSTHSQVKQPNPEWMKLNSFESET